MTRPTAGIVMYTTSSCPYCVAARELLQAHGAPYSEIDVGPDTAARREMVERSGRRTVPQIFIDDRHVGGYDDLADLDRRGELGRLLAGRHAAQSGGADASARNDRHE